MTFQYFNRELQLMMQSRSPDKIFTWGVRRREKVPADLKHCQLMIYDYVYK